MKTLLNPEELDVLLGRRGPVIFDEKPIRFTVYSKESETFMGEAGLAELRRRGTGRFLARLLGKPTAFP